MKRGNIPWAALLLLVVGWLLCALPGVAKDSPQYPKVSLVAFVIEPQSFENTPPRADEAVVVRKLAEEATKQAERSIRRYRLAGAVERVASADAATTPIVVTGTLRLFVSLPPRVRGWDASHRTGHFATVTITILEAKTRAVLAHGEATCDWRDAWWVYGPRNWRNAPLDKVLEHFARKTTERAVKDAADVVKALLHQ